MGVTEATDNIYIKSATDGVSLDEIRRILKAEIICGEDKMDRIVYNACGCDLMSDVLAFTKPGALLLTGLTNAQVIRTAEILDLKCIVFVRNKRPDEATVQMAKENGIPLLSSRYPMYESCGLLYKRGVRGCMEID